MAPRPPPFGPESPKDPLAGGGRAGRAEVHRPPPPTALPGAPGPPPRSPSSRSTAGTRRPEGPSADEGGCGPGRKRSKEDLRSRFGGAFEGPARSLETPPRRPESPARPRPPAAPARRRRPRPRGARGPGDPCLRRPVRGFGPGATGGVRGRDPTPTPVESPGLSGVGGRNTRKGDDGKVYARKVFPSCAYRDGTGV